MPTRTIATLRGSADVHATTAPTPGGAPSCVAHTGSDATSKAVASSWDTTAPARQRSSHDSNGLESKDSKNGLADVSNTLPLKEMRISVPAPYSAEKPLKLSYQPIRTPGLGKHLCCTNKASSPDHELCPRAHKVVPPVARSDQGRPPRHSPNRTEAHRPGLD
eukprot:scaffold451_cov365-Prasinococcus_capsulatus_cf.AAC.32